MMKPRILTDKLKKSPTTIRPIKAVRLSKDVSNSPKRTILIKRQGNQSMNAEQTGLNLTQGNKSPKKRYLNLTRRFNLVNGKLDDHSIKMLGINLASIKKLDLGTRQIEEP